MWEDAYPVDSGASPLGVVMLSVSRYVRVTFKTLHLLVSRRDDHKMY